MQVSSSFLRGWLGPADLVVAFVAALLILINQIKNDDTRKLKEALSALCKQIEHCHWLEMPAVVFRVFERGLFFIPHFMYSVSCSRSRTVVLNALDSLLVSYIGFLLFGWVGLLVGMAISLPFSAVSIAGQYIDHEFKYIPEIIFLVLSSIFHSAVAVLMFYMCITMPLLPSTILLLAGWPIAVYYFASPLVLLVLLFSRSICHDHIAQATVQATGYAGIAVMYGLLLTNSAFLIGSVFDPSQNVDRAPQLVVVNGLFDLLSLLATYWLFKWALGRKNLLWIPLMTIVSLGFSLTLFFCSVFFGLWGIRDLSPFELVIAAFGTDDQGPFRNLGPLFWLMQTSLFPVFLFLLSMFLAWFAKCFLKIVAVLSRKAAANVNPLKLFAAFLVVLVCLFRIVRAILEKWCATE